VNVPCCRPLVPLPSRTSPHPPLRAFIHRRPFRSVRLGRSRPPRRARPPRVTAGSLPHLRRVQTKPPRPCGRFGCRPGVGGCGQVGRQEWAEIVVVGSESERSSRRRLVWSGRQPWEARKGGWAVASGRCRAWCSAPASRDLRVAGSRWLEISTPFSCPVQPRQRRTRGRRPVRSTYALPCSQTGSERRSVISTDQGLRLRLAVSLYLYDWACTVLGPGTSRTRGVEPCLVCSEKVFMKTFRHFDH